MIDYDILIDKNLFAKSDPKKPLVEHLYEAGRASCDKRFMENHDFEAIFLSVVWHDMGKINGNFQKLIHKKIGLSEEWKKLELFKDYPEGINDYPRHEILSAMYFLAFVKSEYKRDKKFRQEKIQPIVNSIVWHHPRNNLIRQDIVKDRNSIRNALSNILISCESPRVDNFFKEFNSWLSRHKVLFKKIMENLYIKFDDDELNEMLGKYMDMENPMITMDDLQIMESIPSFYRINDEGRVAINYEEFYKFHYSGLLKRADYLSSSLGDYTEQFDVEKYSKVINKKINELEKNGYLWQNDYVEKNADAINKNGIILLQAPTGSGKTLFSYIVWDRLKEKYPYLIYVLPYRAALNEKYECDFGSTLEKGLMHSTAFLEFEKSKKGIDGEDGLFYEERKRVLSSNYHYPLIYSTADQILLTSLEYFSCDIFVPLYSKSLVVIDEPQAYDTTQMAVILKTIDIILASKGKVLLMSATFPPWLTAHFEKINYGGDNCSHTIDIKKEDQAKVKNYTTKRHKIKLEEVKDFNALKNKIMKVIKDRKDAKKILVIFNKVKRATEFYRYFKESNKNIKNVHLLHSRLQWSRKNELLKELEKDSWVLIATQIVEAALDLDADLLITDVSPLDSQIQRWGRIFRNRDARDYNGEKENIIIMQEREKKNGQISYIYEKEYIDHAVEQVKKLEKSEKPLSYVDTKNHKSTPYPEKIAEEITEKLEFLPSIANTIERKGQASNIFRESISCEVVLKGDLAYSELREYLDTGSLTDFYHKVKEVKKSLVLKKILVQKSYSLLAYKYYEWKREGRIVEEGELFGTKIISLYNEPDETDKEKILEEGLDYIQDDKFRPKYLL